MLKQFILITTTLSSLTTLSACQERKNPLQDMERTEIVTWLVQARNEKALPAKELLECAKLWADPRSAPPITLESCDKIANKVVNEMNYQKLTVHEIRVPDLEYPLLWKDYVRRSPGSFKELQKKALKKYDTNKPKAIIDKLMK